MPTLYILYYLGLFVVSFIAGLIPLFNRHWRKKNIDLLLTFSGAFLLGITFVHLLPDAVHQLAGWSGILILAGFFGQQIIQHWTHGLEHGHHHISENIVGHSPKIIWPILIGLAIHAFSEGLPLGISYPDSATLPSLVAAIALHKIPEIILVVSLFLAAGKSKIQGFFWVIIFALITPLSAFIARILGSHYEIVGTFLEWCIPVVAGVFIQISTTIFYESSSATHQLKWKKWLMILLGIGVSLLTLI